MPEYTKEQIDEAKEWFGAFIGRKNYGLHEKYGVCLLSALSTAERERDTLKDRERAICKAVGGVSDGGHYRADVIEHLQIVYEKAKERDALAARCAELVEKYYAIRQADLAERNTQYDRAEEAEAERDALAARCAELEARLQGVADRAIAWVESDVVNHRGLRGNDRAELRAAILGEKKED